jgi:hypothetical protein
MTAADLEPGHEKIQMLTFFTNTVSQSSVRTRCEFFQLYPTTTPPGEGWMLIPSLYSVQTEGIPLSDHEEEVTS